MTGKELRKHFVDYFIKKGHEWVFSSPVVPTDDPTLIFTNAGMNQFKPIFLNKEKPKYKRVANYQKCIRVSGKHNDLEEVGRDARHHTFFEMLGNWSFGDYYKKEAIEFAWEYLTEHIKLPKEKLYVTVYEKDDEAEKLWKEVTDVDPSRIFRCGAKDNFWEMGDTGPCGPCSEIHYDRGLKYSSDPENSTVETDGERFFEIWNLVFIQYDRQSDGSLKELPSKHIDTGMGLERLAAVLQNKDSNYETDLFFPLIKKVEELSGYKYNSGPKGMPFRVIADHIRALAFSIADGALPSNDGRGYVIRRLLRRAARYGHNLDIKKPFIYRLLPVLLDIMGEAYPELREQEKHMELVIKSEEERFFRTLSQGVSIFNKLAEENEKKKIHAISGRDAFTLYDTYGFPVDLTRLMAEEKNMNVDIESFNRLMEERKDESRAGGKFQYDEEKNWVELSPGEHSFFKGYDAKELNTLVVKYRENDGPVEVILKETPFYAESGGQVGDQGLIKGEGFEVKVLDTKKTMDGVIHIGTLKGKISSPKVKAAVDSQRSRSISRNHTATHLLQAALREILGDHVHQSGSLVEEERLRFDFTHFQHLSRDEIRRIEEKVNEKIMADLQVGTEYMGIDEAKEKGAMALFGEKYDSIVRVVSIPPFSMELCGGIHCESTGELGFFKIIQETSVAAGVRRVEAVTGSFALKLVWEQEDVLKALQNQFNAAPKALTEKTEALLNENRELKKELESLKAKENRDAVGDLVDKAEKIKGISTGVFQLYVENVEQLRQAADLFKTKLDRYVVVLGSEIKGKVTFIAAVDMKTVKEYSLKAGSLIKEVAAVCGGGGGGKPDFAQAGGKDGSKLPLALKKAKEIIGSTLN